MSRIVFDEPSWWQRPRWRRAGAVVAASAAIMVWGFVLAPAEPTAPRVAAAPVAPAPPVAPSITEAIARPAPAAASAVAAPWPPQQPAPPSTLVAPGVHVTPLSVPPGTESAPAGPRARDSEPEN
jgi:hypothetical protein